MSYFILYYIILYIVLYIILHSIVLHYVILYILHYIIYHNIIYCIILSYTILYYILIYIYIAILNYDEFFIADVFEIFDVSQQSIAKYCKAHMSSELTDTHSDQGIQPPAKRFKVWDKEKTGPFFSTFWPFSTTFGSYLQLLGTQKLTGDFDEVYNLLPFFPGSWMLWERAERFRC